jgi:hypothetical protein
MIAAVLGLALHAQGDLAARIESLERVLQHYYRGERLEAAVDRSTRGIDAYNAHARKLQAEIDRGRAQLEKAMEAGKEDRSRLEEMDRDLKNLPGGQNQDVIKRKVDERNAQAQKVNEQAARHRHAVEEYNAFVKRSLDELERERKGVLAVQESVGARLADFEVFTKTGRDAAFFVEMNRLLADIREALRLAPGDASLAALLARVRELRRELAAWAEVGQSLRPNGLVIVEALVGDEPCWFVVDTGAMDTILSPEIVDAIGCGGSLGKETSLSVVGGLRVSGRTFRIPRLEVGGHVVKDIPASAVLPSDVGIDGLLGQSFLKAFVYTIDERTPGKLLLTPR